MLFFISSSHVGSGIVPVNKLAGFCMVIVFATPRHFVRSHASFFTSPFLFISFSTCFFHVCFGLPLPLLPLTSNFKAFTITFLSSFLKTWPYHRILLALAILSKDPFMPNMSINSSLFLRSNSFTLHIARIFTMIKYFVLIWELRRSLFVLRNKTIFRMIYVKSMGRVV